MGRGVPTAMAIATKGGHHTDYDSAIAAGDRNIHAGASNVQPKHAQAEPSSSALPGIEEAYVAVESEIDVHIRMLDAARVQMTTAAAIASAAAKESKAATVGGGGEDGTTGR